MAKTGEYEVDYGHWKGKCYDMGPSGLGLYNKEVPPNAKWIVSWYKVDGYDGSGAAVMKVGRGTYYYTSISHCSCFGPLDEDDPWGKPVGDYRALIKLLTHDPVIEGRPRDPNDHDYVMHWEILKKVRQLHRQELRAKERRRAKRSEQVSSGVQVRDEHGQGKVDGA